MDNIGSMNSLRDDAGNATRIGKNANARRASDQENAGAFDDLLAGLTVSNVVPAQPSIQQETPQVSQATPNPTTQAGETAPVAQSPNATTTGSATGNTTSSPEQIKAATTDGVPALIPSAILPQALAQSQGQSQSQSEVAGVSEAVLAQLANVGIDEQVATLQQVQVQANAVPSATAKTTPPSVTTNASTLSASRSNVGVAAALQNDAEPATLANAGSQTPSNPANTTAIVSNDNATLVSQNKVKPAEVDLTTKTPGQSLEPVSTTLDGAGSTSVISGQEIAAPANDQANRAPQLTPHTIPMLAATMMRRLDSGSKQFTMRLDPPELGQVEVKLTVAADKKVRAVVSADRPEALADLVRSARELARALAEAGLDLEDNGLTFQMNDPSAGGQQDQTRDRQSANAGPISSNITDALEAELSVSTAKIQTPTDPFERWQRARIALTA